MAFKKAKIESLVKEVLSSALLQKYSNPKLGLVTITTVKVTPDLRIAKVYVSVLPTENREEALEWFETKKGALRSEVAHNTRLRFTPELNFYIDDTLDYVEKMEDLFKKIRKDDNEQD